MQYTSKLPPATETVLLSPPGSAQHAAAAVYHVHRVFTQSHKVRMIDSGATLTLYRSVLAELRATVEKNEGRALLPGEPLLREGERATIYLGRQEYEVTR